MDTFGPKLKITCRKNVYTARLGLNVINSIKIFELTTSEVNTL